MKRKVRFLLFSTHQKWKKFLQLKKNQKSFVFRLYNLHHVRWWCFVVDSIQLYTYRRKRSLVSMIDHIKTGLVNWFFIAKIHKNLNSIRIDVQKLSYAHNSTSFYVVQTWIFFCLIWIVHYSLLVNYTGLVQTSVV